MLVFKQKAGNLPFPTFHIKRPISLAAIERIEIAGMEAGNRYRDDSFL